MDFEIEADTRLPIAYSQARLLGTRKAIAVDTRHPHANKPGRSMWVSGMSRGCRAPRATTVRATLVGTPIICVSAMSRQLQPGVSVLLQWYAVVILILRFVVGG